VGWEWEGNLHRTTAGGLEFFFIMSQLPFKRLGSKWPQVQVSTYVRGGIVGGEEGHKCKREKTLQFWLIKY
jgi:hypothetical protein